MSKVELYAAIRRDHRAGMKMRELERKYNVSWRTVKKAVDSVWPEPRKKLPPRRTALDPYKPVIDEMLRTDLDAPRKQRHTITRIFHRLIEEHGAQVSYPMVRRYVADRKPEILAASGKAPVEAFVPQTHRLDPGPVQPQHLGDRRLQVVVADLGSRDLFSLRLSYSGKAVHRVFASCGQEAFFEGHVHALRTLGGVATALEQARSAGKFTPVHDAWWAQARKLHGERDGTRALIEVLLLGRHLAHEHVVAGLATALRAGALTADAVALEARKAAQTEDEPPIGASVPTTPGQAPATVTSLHEWRLAHLPPDTRPLPSVTLYDQLLRRRRTSGSDHHEGEAQ